MQQRVLTDLNDAFDMVVVALDQIPKATSPDGERIRVLFKLFFGVSFNSVNHQVNATGPSTDIYKFVYCMSEMPNSYVKPRLIVNSYEPFFSRLRP